jgi:hypothetical protein
MKRSERCISGRTSASSGLSVPPGPRHEAQPPAQAIATPHADASAPAVHPAAAAVNGRAEPGAGALPSPRTRCSSGSDLGPPDETAAATPPNGASPRRRGPCAREGEREESARSEPARSRPPSAEEHGFGDEHVGTGASRRDDEERDDFTQFAAWRPTLYEHLEQQLALIGLTERDRRHRRDGHRPTWTRTATSSRTWRSCASPRPRRCPTSRSRTLQIALQPRAEPRAHGAVGARATSPNASSCS